jgi:hypothetical protein
MPRKEHPPRVDAVIATAVKRSRALERRGMGISPRLIRKRLSGRNCLDTLKKSLRDVVKN